MNQAAFNKVARAQVRALLREGRLDAATARDLESLYPVTPWDWHSLGRWFTILGALSAAAGVVVLSREFLEFTLPKLALGLGVLTGVALATGHALKKRDLPWTARVAELVAGLALIATTFTVGAIYSDGSGHWPVLLLPDLLLILLGAYLLNNLLLLILSAVVFFTWFGGETGYVAGWGAYWFGMNYPLRFAAASSGMVVMGVVHMLSEQGPLRRWRGFAKVWISAGLFLLEMSVWIMSLFGNFGDMHSWRVAPNEELIVFNAIWALLNAALVFQGARQQFKMLTGYGATFGIIQGYTLFFAHIAPHLGVILATLAAGGSALALVFGLERRRRELRAQQED